MTRAMKSALLWLRRRNGDGMFAKDGVMLAGGQRAPIMRSTWNRLRDDGMVEEYQDHKRLRVTPLGFAVSLTDVHESK